MSLAPSWVKGFGRKAPASAEWNGLYYVTPKEVTLQFRTPEKLRPCFKTAKEIR